MAKSTQLYDEFGEKLYPFALTTLIFDATGGTLEARLQAVEKMLDWFELDEDSLIKAKYGFYSVGGLTAGGKRSSTGSSSTNGSTTLAGLEDVLVSDPEDGDVLMYSKGSDGSGKWISWNKQYALWNLSDVSDDDVAAEGQVLMYTKGMWRPATISGGSGSSGGSSTLAGLEDVLVSDPEDGDVLMYSKGSDGSGKWISWNKQYALWNLSDVSDDDVAAEGQVLMYTKGMWRPATISGGSGSSGGSSTLAGLEDVSVGGASAGQSLVYDGTRWIPRLISGGGSEPSGLGQLAYKDGLSFEDLTGHPTDLAGYGITDALSKTGTAAAALKLSDASAFSIWGNTFFSSGVPKSVTGSITLPYGSLIYITDSDGTALRMIQINDAYDVLIAQGCAHAGYDTFIYGDNLHFKVKEGLSEALTILSDGKVGIMKQRPEYTLDVEGDIRATTIRIGEATLTWDEDAGMLKFDKGIYSTGAVTAGGKGSSNKYRLDSWAEWTVDSDGNVTDAKLLESSLSARLGVELNKRLVALEDSSSIGAVSINVRSIASKSTMTNAEGITAGLTYDVVKNLLDGRYTKVLYKDDNGQEVWDYTASYSTDGTSLYFRQGDGADIHNSISMKRTSAVGVWTIIFTEI